MTTNRAMLIDDLMQSEATGLEEIFGDPSDTLGEAYDDLQTTSQLDVEEALGFAYRHLDVIDEEKDIMETLNELYDSGMTLTAIKNAMRDWIKHFLTTMSDAVLEYEDFINLTYNTIQKSNQNKITIKERLQILDKIEKCMNNHMKWGFTMSVFKKFEKQNKAITKIQSRFKGNKDRQMLESSGLWYQDATSHWKEKNKNKVLATLLGEMITEDMTNTEQAEARELIRVFMREKGFMTELGASKKQQRKKKKPKKTKKKKTKKKQKKTKKKPKKTKKKKTN